MIQNIVKNCSKFSLYYLLFCVNRNRKSVTKDKSTFSVNKPLPIQIFGKATLSRKPCDVERVVFKDDKIIIYVNLLNILGIDNFLENYYVESIMHKNQMSKAAAINLLSMFSQRTIELFYKAECSSNLHLSTYNNSNAYNEELNSNENKNNYFDKIIEDLYQVKESEMERTLASFAANFNLHNIRTFLICKLKIKDVQVSMEPVKVPVKSFILGSAQTQGILGNSVYVMGSISITIQTSTILQYYQLISSSVILNLVNIIKYRTPFKMPVLWKVICDRVIEGLSKLGKCENEFRLGLNMHLGAARSLRWLASYE